MIQCNITSSFNHQLTTLGIRLELDSDGCPVNQEDYDLKVANLFGDKWSEFEGSAFELQTSIIEEFAGPEYSMVGIIGRLSENFGNTPILTLTIISQNAPQFSTEISYAGEKDKMKTIYLIGALIGLATAYREYRNAN